MSCFLSNVWRFAFSQEGTEEITGLLLSFCLITPKRIDVLHIQKELNLPKPPIYVAEGLDYESCFLKLSCFLNKRITGVYGWLCILFSECYVGSGRDLSRRPFHHLTPSKTSNIILKNALKKYGVGEFVLIIFEALGSRDVIPLHVQFEKENEYLQLVVSKYNIHNTANRPLDEERSDSANHSIIQVVLGDRRIKKKIISSENRRRKESFFWRLLFSELMGTLPLRISCFLS